MRKIYLLSTLVLTIFFGTPSSSQDFSNKGKDFYLCFPQHVPSGTQLATLAIFITSDKASSGTITMANSAFSATFNIPAYGIQEISIPWNALIHISNAESNTVIKKSIRIKTDVGKPAVVAYAQQWAGARSAATLLLPVNVLGKKYRTISFTQNGSNQGTYIARSQFQIIAVKNNTVVEITPFKNGVKGSKITITLPLAGDMYQYQSTDPGAATQDLTGTYIESIASLGGGCNPIAVFSGSSNTTFGTPTCSGGSYDPLWQQDYPVSTWGKNFGLIPFADYPAGVPYRVLASEDNTVVSINGAVVTTLNAGQIYPPTFTSNPTVLTAPTNITADKPICVAEYAQADACTGQTGPRVGDPDMVILNPIEQNIRDITVFSSTRQAITRQWINILIKTISVPSFKISRNGGPLNPPSGTWQTFATLPGYSYLQESLIGVNSARMLADSSFNAIAYGWGNVESYAYSAGTNVKDLYQQIGVVTEYGIEPTPSVCTGAPFQFRVSLPYCADSIEWDLSGLPGPPVPTYPKVIYTTCTPGPGGPDSTTVVNGVTLYWYSLPSIYTMNIVGIYPVTISVFSPNADGCGTEQDIDFDLEVSNPPVADFTFVTNGCATQPVNFTDATNTVKPTYRWWWDFGDPASGPNNTSNLKNPTHLFSGPGTYTVRFSNITTPGCLSDTVSHQVIITDPPLANFSISAPACVGTNITFTDNSSVTTGSIAKWTWDFGDATPVVVVIAPNPPNQVHAYAVAGTYNATLKVESNTGCQSLLFTLPITILNNGTLSLSSGTGTDNQIVCINTPIIPITYQVGGSGTGGSVSGLPTGVNGNFAGGVITISGTPTVSGTYTYTVTTTGPCATPSATGTITVTQDATLNLSSPPGSDNQTVCVNTPIATISYSVAGSGSGGIVTGLPAGVTGTYSGGVITISGTPTVSGTFTYTATATGPCAGASATGTIIVTPGASLTLTSAAGTDNQTVCINTPIVNITYTVSGSGTGGSVTGLPTGVSGIFAGGVITISGTPTVSGTYTYTVSSTGPCATPNLTGTITVTANATVTLTSPAGTDNQTVCVNTSLIPITYAAGGSGSGGTVTGLPAGVSWVFAGGVITITGSPTANGVYPYTVNITGPCQPSSITGTITVTSNASIILTSAPGTNNQTICVNTALTTITYAVGGSATGASVSGLPPGITGALSGGIFTISGTPTSAVGSPFTYTISVSGPCGTPSATGQITVNGDATITLTSPASTTLQEMCFNQPITNITYAVGGTGTGATVTGLPAGVTGSYAGGVVTISGTATVTGTFNYTVTTTGICAAVTATGTIIINALPTSNFNFTAPSCDTRLITFTDLSVPNTGTITTWSWDFGDPASGPNNISSLPSPTHTFSSRGTYNVRLVVTTDKGCVSTAPARQVVVDARPLAGFIVPEVCLNDTFAQFGDTSKVSAPDNIVAWDWNFGDPSSGPNNISTLQNPQHAYTATGSYTVQLVATSNRGCKDTVQQILFVNGSFPQADFTVNSPTALCANDSVSIVEASTVFPGIITKVEIYWDNVGQPGVFVTDNFPVTGKIYKHLYPNFQAPLTRNFTIRYRAYSGGVCVNDKFRTITVNAAPKVQFNNMPDACLDAAPFQITQASEIGGVPGNGVFSGPGVTPGGIFNPASVGPGVYTIKYTYTSSAAGCVDTLSKTIKVLAPPVADFSVAAPSCETKAITFTDNSTTPAGSLTTWTWDFGDASPLVIRNNAAPFTHTFGTSGTYQVKLKVTTSDGCISTQKVIPVTVNPQPKANFSTPVSACLPDASVSFGNLSSIADGSQGSFTYLWNFGDPGSGANNSSVLANPSHIYTAMGPYNIKLQVTSNNGCVHDTTIVFNSIHPQPLASFTVDKIDVCVGGSFDFNNTSNPLDGTTTQINWVMDDGNVKSTPSFTYTYANAGTYNVSLFIFNSNGCRSTTATKTVFVNPYPPVNAGPDKFMLEGGQVTLTPALNASMPVTYLWTPNQYLSDPTIAYTIASPPEDKTYTLTITTNKGCSRSDDVFVKVLKAPAIPNIFSPNGDGVHDKWVIQYLESYPGCTVDIFNRYGQLVFHSEGYTTPWDGTVRGTPVPVGTYYYIVNPKNGRKIMSGYVDVIR
ncbi:MAG: PKD domain-containing protein [Chitinophagaceae bacterium]